MAKVHGYLFDVECNMPSEAELLEKANLQMGGLVQQTIDKAVIDYSLAYVPWDSGTLAKSPYAVTQIGRGEVIYPGPYARYLYYGFVMGPNIPIFSDDSGDPTGWFSPPGKKKRLTGATLSYSTDVNPLAGPFWFERMKADHLADIIQEAKDAAGIK